MLLLAAAASSLHPTKIPIASTYLIPYDWDVSCLQDNGIQNYQVRYLTFAPIQMGKLIRQLTFVAEELPS